MLRYEGNHDVCYDEFVTRAVITVDIHLTTPFHDHITFVWGVLLLKDVILHWERHVRQGMCIKQCILCLHVCRC